MAVAAANAATEVPHAAGAAFGAALPLLGAALDSPLTSPLNSPLSARLLEFNLLPSRSLHPNRRALLRPATSSATSSATSPASERLAALPRVARELHRDWSALLLDLLDTLDAGARRPVLAAGEPALPLALAQPELLGRLARDAGLVLLGRHLRRTVLRADVAAAREAIGADGLAFARGAAADAHPGLDDVADWLPSGAASLPAAADLLGAGVLAQAWHDAAPALRRRADLKLPAEAELPRVREASGLRTAAARDLCLTLLNRIEPAWLSLFPTPAATR
jgi:type III secretion protein K